MQLGWRLGQVVIACSLALAFPSESRSDPVVEGFVSDLSQGMQAIRAQMDAPETHRLERCRALMNRMLELDAMARSVASGIWEKMQASQRTAFRAAFETRMAANCVRAARDYNGAPIWLAGVRPAGEQEYLVTVGVGLAAGGERMVTWRLRNVAGRIRAVDIIADGRSVVAAERSEYAAILRSNDENIDASIVSLKRKL